MQSQLFLSIRQLPFLQFLRAPILFRELIRDNREGSVKVIAVIVIVVVVVALVALSVYYYNAYHNLKFELTSVGVENLSVQSFTLNFGLTINNTNLLPVYIPSGYFEIYINGAHLGAGTFNSVTIGGNSLGEIVSPVTFNTTDIPSVIYFLIVGGGNITVASNGAINLWLFEVPFNTTVYETKVT
jgi:LEA14-like dessication related protein